MNEKIGKVTLNLDYYEGQDFYSDGVIEEHLLELVKHHEPEEYQDIILKEKNWAVMYHLSQQRENILEWYPITKTKIPCLKSEPDVVQSLVCLQKKPDGLWQMTCLR